MNDDRKRLNGLEMEGWQCLAMMVIICDALERKTNMKKLLDSRTEHGWRDWRLATTTLDRVNEEVLKSVPEKQLRTIRANVQQNTIKFTPRFGASPLPPDMWSITREDLATLADKAVATECAVCFREDYYNCPLHKVLKSLPLELSTEGEIFCRCMRKLEI